MSVNGDEVCDTMFGTTKFLQKVMKAIDDVITSLITDEVVAETIETLTGDETRDALHGVIDIGGVDISGFTYCAMESRKSFPFAPGKGYG